MAIEGPLRELSIHDVFQLLDLSRKTGVLRVESDLRDNAGTIYFQRGSIVYAEIRSNPHVLGELLVRTGRITRAELEEGRELQRRQGDRPRIGEILVTLGVITSRDLQRHVRLQVEEVVFEVTSWTEGHFSFSEGPLEGVPPDGGVRIRVEALLMEGARRIDEWSRIEKRIPHLGVVPALSPSSEGSEGQLDLLPPEWEVLALIDGARDVRAMAADLSRSEFDVAKTLFGLESAGVIVLLAPAGVPQSGLPDTTLEDLGTRVEAALARRDLEGARAAAERVVTALPQDASAHLTLGRVQLAAGRPQAALESLARAVRLDARLAAAHRVQGYALAALGRFQDAVESWDQWERLAPRATGEAVHAQAVEQARAAARLLAGAIAHG
jgi:hypothetical protein